MTRLNYKYIMCDAHKKNSVIVTGSGLSGDTVLMMVATVRTINDRVGWDIKQTIIQSI